MSKMKKWQIVVLVVVVVGAVGLVSMRVTQPSRRGARLGQGPIKVAWSAPGRFLCDFDARPLIYGHRVYNLVPEGGEGNGIFFFPETEWSRVYNLPGEPAIEARKVVSGKQIWKTRVKGSPYQAAAAGQTLAVASWTDMKPPPPFNWAHPLPGHFEGTPCITALSSDGMKLWEAELPRCSALTMYSIPGVILVDCLSYGEWERHASFALRADTGEKFWEQAQTRVVGSSGSLVVFELWGFPPKEIRCLRFGDGKPQLAWSVMPANNKELWVLTDSTGAVGWVPKPSSAPLAQQRVASLRRVDMGTGSVQPIRVPEIILPHMRTRGSLFLAISGWSWPPSAPLLFDWSQGGNMRSIPVYVEENASTGVVGIGEAAIYVSKGSSGPEPTNLTLQRVSLDGKTSLWSANLGGHGIPGTCEVNEFDGIVWVNLQARLLALDKTTGRVLWSSDWLGPRITGSAKVFFFADMGIGVGPIAQVHPYEGGCLFSTPKEIFVLRVRRGQAGEAKAQR